MNTKPIEIPSGWFTREGMAAILGVTPQHFDRSYRPIVQATDKQTVNRRPLFRARGLIDVLVSRADRSNDPATADPLLTTGNSPALEQYREARAGLAQIELSEKRREVVRADALQSVMQPAITVMRETGDRLIRKFGNEAGEIFNEGISEFEQSAVAALESFQKPTNE